MPSRGPVEDAKVLSFGDIVLRASDVSLLEGPHWLNDQIIAFYYEYAAVEKFEDLSGLVLLLPGAMSFLLSNCSPEEAALVLEPLAVRQKELVMFAVNDNTDVEAAGGGSHWTLLLYSRSASSFRHYDSQSNRSSRAAATKLYRAVHKALAAGRDCPLVHVEEMPQQQNGYDCGVYVLMVTDSLCSSAARSWSKTARTRSGMGMSLDFPAEEHRLSTWLTPKAVSAFRAHLLDLVTELRQRH